MRSCKIISTQFPLPFAKLRSRNVRAFPWANPKCTAVEKKSERVATEVSTTLGLVRLSDRLQTFENRTGVRTSRRDGRIGHDRSPEMMGRRFFFYSSSFV